MLKSKLSYIYRSINRQKWLYQEYYIEIIYQMHCASWIGIVEIVRNSSQKREIISYTVVLGLMYLVWMCSLIKVFQDNRKDRHDVSLLCHVLIITKKRNNISLRVSNCIFECKDWNEKKLLLVSTKYIFCLKILAFQDWIYFLFRIKKLGDNLWESCFEWYEVFQNACISG